MAMLLLGILVGASIVGVLAWLWQSAKDKGDGPFGIGVMIEVELVDAARAFAAETCKAGYAPCKPDCSHEWCRKLARFQRALDAL